jgi:hypothetical protein
MNGFQTGGQFLVWVIIGFCVRVLLMELSGSLGCCWWGYILHAVWTRTEANPLWSELHTDERWVISTPNNSVVGANLANSSQLDREGSAGKGTRSCRSDVWVGRASAIYYVAQTVCWPKDQIPCLKFWSSAFCLIVHVSVSYEMSQAFPPLCFPTILGGLHST